MVRKTSAALAVIGVLAVHAAAEPVASSLEWSRASGAEGCIDEGALIAKVELRLGGSLAERTARRVVGQIDRLDDGFRVRLVVRDEAGEIVGERELVEPGGDCHRLDDKLALVIALLVDDEAAARRAPIAAAPPAPPSPAIDRDDPLAAPRASRADWAVDLGVAGMAAMGVLPGLGLGARVALALAPPALPRLEVSIGGWMPDRFTVASGAIRFALADATLAACPRLVTAARWETRACVGAGIARMTATGSGFDTNQRAIDWIGHAIVTGVLDVPIHGRVRGTLELAGWVPLVRPRFVYADGVATHEAYQPPAVAGVLGLGVAVAL